MNPVDGFHKMCNGWALPVLLVALHLKLIR